MELTDTNKPCGLTISFLNKVIYTLLFNFQWTRKKPGKSFALDGIPMKYMLSAVSGEAFFDTDHFQWTSFLSFAFPSEATMVPYGKEIKSAKKNTRFFGGHSEEAPPVPIPNTEVKLLSADGTAWVTMWESRSLPILLKTKPLSDNSDRGFVVSEVFF